MRIVSEKPTDPSQVIESEANLQTFLNEYLPPGELQRSSDQSLEDMLTETAPVGVEISGLMNGIKAGTQSTLSLPSGREISESENKLRWLGWAALLVILLGGFVAVNNVAIEKQSATSGEPDLEEWQLDFPPPVYVGTPSYLQSESDVSLGDFENFVDAQNARKTLRLPKNARENIALGKRITGSMNLPLEGKYGFLCDGNRSADAFLTLGPEEQWVQVDLGENYELFGLIVWHEYGSASIYRDVVIQVSKDASFASATTVFNNDHDSSASYSRAVGSDPAYVESNYGRIVEMKGDVGRFVRIYSNGSTRDEMSRFVELEVFGRRAADR